MPRHARYAGLAARIARGAAWLEALEIQAHHYHRHLGPILKEALASLWRKLETIRQRDGALEQVSSMRADILGAELEPMLDAWEDGLAGLDGIVWSLDVVAAKGQGDNVDELYEHVTSRERWWLGRLRHVAGEWAEGSLYRCCSCGAKTVSGGGTLRVCDECGGTSHYQVREM